MFQIVCGSGMPKDSYLAMAVGITGIYFTVECWGCAKRLSRHKGHLNKINIPKNDVPTTKALAKNAYSKSWTCEIQFNLKEYCVLVRNAVVLPTCKLNAATQVKLLKLPDNLILHRFINWSACCVSSVCCFDASHTHTLFTFAFTHSCKMILAKQPTDTLATLCHLQ